MTGTDAFGRIDWLKAALGDVANLILHMRAQAVPSMQARAEPRVSGSKERTTAPLSVDPLDEADDLWGRVCSLAIDYADRSGSWQSLPDVIDRQWLVAASAEFTVAGFATQDPDRIYADIVAVTRYLRDHAYSLALNTEYTVPVDDLVAEIRSAHARYPEAPDRRHRHRCPKCGKHGVVAVYSESGEIRALSCELCGAKRDF